ncbi:hypothetical protein PAHAL_2G223500 [Panicum hallii]|uniref:Uncharacterized protein n=1 Tax=Panicum hallii TaxID=206008 RepID=A0A2T8KPY5_9POAL|nr:hypothetical protein PAHAL_2G223500 [Panicum hallii]
MITFCSRLLRLIMQCSLIFHLLAHSLKKRRIGFLHKHLPVFWLQKAMLLKRRLLLPHISFS